jgi:hypothetical protein
MVEDTISQSSFSPRRGQETGEDCEAARSRKGKAGQASQGSK